MALSPPPSNLDTLSGCPRALGLGPLLLQICLHMVGEEGWTPRPGAGDIPESLLPGPSQPEEVGGAGPVTHFSFRFCQESGGNLLK